LPFYDSFLILKVNFSLNQGFDTIIHVLNEFSLGSSKSSLVRDIVDTIIGLGVFTVNTSNLDIVLVSNSVEHLFVLLSKEWELDMN